MHLSLWDSGSLAVQEGKEILKWEGDLAGGGGGAVRKLQKEFQRLTELPMRTSKKADNC